MGVVRDLMNLIDDGTSYQISFSRRQTLMQPAAIMTDCSLACVVHLTNRLSLPPSSPAPPRV